MDFLRRGIRGRIKKRKRKNILIKKGEEEGQGRGGNEISCLLCSQIDGSEIVSSDFFAKNLIL